MLYFVRSKEVEHEPFFRQGSQKGLKVTHLLGSIRGGSSPRSLYPLFMLRGGGVPASAVRAWVAEKKKGGPHKTILSKSTTATKCYG